MQLNKNLSGKLLDEIDKLEIQECYTAIRTFIDKRTRLAVFFGTGNFTLVGLSILHQNSLFLIAGGCCVLFYIIVDSLLRSHLTAYVFTGLSIEKKYGRELGLIRCEMLTHFKGLEFSDRLIRLIESNNPIQISNGFRQYKIHPFEFRGKPMLLMLAVGIVQIILGIALTYLLKWSLF